MFRALRATVLVAILKRDGDMRVQTNNCCEDRIFIPMAVVILETRET